MEISAKQRTIKGSKVSQLRRAGLITGSIFSTKSSREKTDSIKISLDQTIFSKLYKDAGESTLIKVVVEKDKTRECLISEVQYHPVTLSLTNVNFYEVDLTSKITANIPIEIIGEELNPITKAGEAILLTVLSEIEVECLPRDLPQHFEIDVSQMKEIGEMISIADAIHVDESKVTILTDKTEVLLKLDFAEQKELEVEEEKSVEDVEVEDKGKKEDEEGEEDSKEAKE
ncbi:50S ribosomal protein L25 [candidate division WWE3 bacterium CG_4_9_14_0_2_um_filter_35_11]|uniref:Large ribosomal subunit protein bL25 n=1 Tax=candidate division WWE3 bacterium CG_4_9_14_0_2_um_filter_35_11 TaxID=1975077 RepID=A0A2M8EL59_UNCKA|nr:MAG: 50S ribosomal protein L25 [candidate division WWE3 bacterium CG10_big_fil_rev_8_21_14_0_10_35_32]PJC23440.1 MAG: 50S ribosomal protein L25 [candidate division WWE3 bacterium CG_4_9_14_0_2_um_filter_35_11]